MYLWSSRLYYRNDPSPLTFSDVGIFFRVELSGNASKFKKNKEILLRTFTSSMRHHVRKIHQNSRRSRAGTTKKCILCVAGAKKKGEGRGKSRKKPGGDGEFSFLPNPFSFCPSLPIPFRRLKLLCLSILQ